MPDISQKSWGYAGPYIAVKRWSTPNQLGVSESFLIPAPARAFVGGLSGNPIFWGVPSPKLLVAWNPRYNMAIVFIVSLGDLHLGVEEGAKLK